MTAVPWIVRAGPLVAGGYVCVWAVFGVVAAIVQWCLAGAGLLSDGMFMRNTLLSAGLVIGAAIYELTPWKAAFLRQCRLAHCEVHFPGRLQRFRPAFDRASLAWDAVGGSWHCSLWWAS
jgi:predicted metal-binding membrane protein